MCNLCNEIYSKKQRVVCKKSFNRKLRNLLKALSIKLSGYKINSEKNKILVFSELVDWMIRKGANYLLPIDKIKMEDFLQENLESFEEIESKMYFNT
jgi:hypothetical protein